MQVGVWFDLSRKSDEQLNTMDITLQINLCPGDVDYAEELVPRLVEAHRGCVRHRLAIVDLNRPQRTHANRREYENFEERIGMIHEIARSFEKSGLMDEVVILDGRSRELYRELSGKFTGGLIPASVTHDYHGAAYAAYLAALHLPATRYVLHYDADILLYQQPGFDWAREALNHWEANPDVIAATPRTAPPGFEPDAPTLHEGRPFAACPGGWANDWFSTRCFLMDLDRLQPFLPLLRGRYALEMLFYRLIKRRYPPGPELMLFQSAGSRGARRLNLNSREAWILHPTSKPMRYLELLPSIISHVQQGNFPNRQCGHSEVDLQAWEAYLADPPSQ